MLEVEEELTSRWLMDMCPTILGWQAWLILCVVVVVLWAAAVVGAAALFRGSARPARREQRRQEEFVGSGDTAAR